MIVDCALRQKPREEKREDRKITVAKYRER